MLIDETSDCCKPVSLLLNCYTMAKKGVRATSAGAKANKLHMIELEGNSQPFKAIKGRQHEVLITGTKRWPVLHSRSDGQELGPVTPAGR